MSTPFRIALFLLGSLCLAAFAAPPPLKVDRSAPLMLLDEPKADAKPKQPKAKAMVDNEACYVCHNNYREEEMALSHAKENVGCVKCHGSSEAHRGDEDNITPPDVMYPTAEIDKSCRQCHEEHNAAARTVIKRWQDRCPEKRNVEQVVCTDCHGYHRLAHRSVRWDKKTHKLLEKEEGKKNDKGRNPNDERMTKAKAGMPKD